MSPRRVRSILAAVVLALTLAPAGWALAQDKPNIVLVLADDLGMDATQRAQLDTVLDERNRQSDSLMSPVRPQLDSLGAQTRQRIRQLLTPEQQATYDQMLREREDARRQEKRQ